MKNKHLISQIIVQFKEGTNYNLKIWVINDILNAFWYYKLPSSQHTFFLYFSLSNQEPVKRVRNRNVQRSSSEDTDTNGKKYETRNKLSFNKYLKNFKMSSTVVDSYSSMESPVFSIPQHRKIRRGLSDIDPKYVSQVRHFSIPYSLFWSIDIPAHTN